MGRDLEADFAKMMKGPNAYAMLNKLILRDLNKNPRAPSFYLYSKDDITSYLKNPYVYQKQLRDAVTYIYGASSHFRRLIQYFVGLSDLSYVVSPHKIDPTTANKRIISNNYRKVLNVLSNMSVKTQFPKILTVCLREDAFYGTLWETKDNITVQQLPTDWCSTSTIEGNVFNVTFNFAYFDTNPQYLPYYPPEFTERYNAYRADMVNMKWQELSSPRSFAIKVNNDIPNYTLPPFAGILREVYDLEDYKQLKLTKTALENYAMLTMKLDMDDEGDWVMPLEKAKDFWRNLDGVLPEEIGSVLTPMDIDKISFERSHTGDTDTIADAEQNLFSAAGVSSLLFNNDKASANALVLSIKADQAITFGIVKSIEDMVNRYLQSLTAGKNFKVTFLDCSPFNRKDVGDMYIKACQYGLPFVSMYAASQGLSQTEVDSMNFLENDVLDLKSKLIPLSNSNTMPAEGEGATEEGGAPPKDTGEISDSGLTNKEAL